MQVEKDGYLKAFRRVTAGPGPARVSVPLAERRRDRGGEIVRRVLALRGSDPGTHRPLIAQVSQLARVDVLVSGAPTYIRPSEAEVKYPDGVPGALRKR